MEYIAEKKPNSELKRKVCSPSEVFKLKEVQEIKDAMLEHLIFIGLDRGNNVRKVNLLSIGTSCNTLIDSKSIIRNAITSGSDKVILVHNHPSNSLQPSKQDEYATSIITKILPIFNIELTDHVIVTEDSYLRMEHLKMINEEVKNKDYELLDKALLTEENEKLKKENEELKRQLSEEKNLEDDMEI